MVYYDIAIWNAVVPSYDQHPLYAPKLKASVAVGSFVRCDIDKNAIFQIVSNASSGCLVVSIFRSIHASKYAGMTREIAVGLGSGVVALSTEL